MNFISSVLFSSDSNVVNILNFVILFFSSIVFFIIIYEKNIKTIDDKNLKKDKIVRTILISFFVGFIILLIIKILFMLLWFIFMVK